MPRGTMLPLEEKTQALQEVRLLQQEGGYSITKACRIVAKRFKISPKTINGWIHTTGPIQEEETIPDKPRGLHIEQIQKPKFRARISADVVLSKCLGKKVDPQDCSLMWDDAMKELIVEWES